MSQDETVSLAQSDIALAPKNLENKTQRKSPSQLKKLFHWTTPLTSLTGVAEKTAEKLAKLGIATVGDLLLHFPSRYQDRTHLTPIIDILPEQYVVVQGKIIQCKASAFRQKKRCHITLMDKSASLQIVFFHFHPSMIQKWQPGVLLRCFGQVKLVANKLQLVHPECEVIEEGAFLPSFLTPIYPLTAGLTQSWFRKTIEKVLAGFTSCQETDLFAEQLNTTYPILGWFDALKEIHQPSNESCPQALSEREHPAFKRLILEELFAYYVSMQRLKSQISTKLAIPLSLLDSLYEQFRKALPFALTASQEKVWQEIQTDLKKTSPMHRLVQGDVGCGKTVIAALTALCAVSNKMQVAIMVPTEILAAQHYEAFCQWFSPLGFRCDMMTGKLKVKEKRLLNENIQLGLSHIVIGTHALFQESIKFQQLGLVIIDEQHRFGVHQRFALHEKGLSSLEPNHPHQLVMTATPIPRTLAMSHYAHLDISTIETLPAGRKPITTLTIPQTRRQEVIEKITKICDAKQQVYWVCTLIEGSEKLDAQAASMVAEEIKSHLPQYSVGLIHGRLLEEEKSFMMQSFYEGKIQILVATTVIEVGVNAPEASLIVIENPERLGLAQLHQLRGRVGRGNHQSYCILLYQSPCSEVANARLRIMRESQDGFYIAQADLMLRGSGEILGTRQTGDLQFKAADLIRDEKILKEMPEIAKKLTTLPATYLDDIIQRWCPTNHYYQS